MVSANKTSKFNNKQTSDLKKYAVNFPMKTRPDIFQNFERVQVVNRPIFRGDQFIIL